MQSSNFIGNGGLPQINVNLSGGPAPVGPPTPNSSHHQPQLGPLANEHLIRIVLEVRDSEDPISSKGHKPPRKLSGKTQTSTTQKKAAKDRQFEDDDDSACSNVSQFSFEQQAEPDRRAVRPTITNLCEFGPEEQANEDQI